MRVFEQPVLFCSACGDMMQLTGYQPPSIVSRKHYREIVCKNAHCDEHDKIGRLPVLFHDVEELPTDERRS